jgi:threonine aldolase
VATLLGKERALFLPTGTLANHLAVRVLAGDSRKALVQAESHLYRDEGDCAQLLSGLNLVALGPGRASLTADEVAKAVDEAAGPPYPAPVGAISIESPVRRTDGQVFDFEEMKKVCAYALGKHIGTHLDGARLFLASGYTGISPAQYAALFDTVYISMYKYFNAPFGAVLSGPASLIAKVEPLRHQFGSLIYQGWESAAVALHHFDGFSERYRSAVRTGEKHFNCSKPAASFVSSGSHRAAISPNFVSPTAARSTNCAIAWRKPASVSAEPAAPPSPIFKLTRPSIAETPPISPRRSSPLLASLNTSRIEEAG